MEGPRKYEIPKRALAEFRRILREESGIEAPPRDARRAAESLLSLFETIGRHKHDVRMMEERLREFPDGYPLPPDSDHGCWICRGGRRELREVWFDRTGVKCEHCYLMFRRRALPLSVATDRESWYDDRDLAHRLGMSPRAVEEGLRSGKLAARTVKGTGFRLFLVRENPQLPSPRPDIS